MMYIVCIVIALEKSRMSFLFSSHTVVFSGDSVDLQKEVKSTNNMFISMNNEVGLFFIYFFYY